MDPRTRSLIEINIDDILAALGWDTRGPARGLIRALAWLPARRFAREMTVFDDTAARTGVPDAAASLVRRFVNALHITGMECVPRTGPVLLLSNHPGMTDTLVLVSSIPRGDLQILAAERPFLKALPAAVGSLIFIPEERARRVPAVRRAITHLRKGGALLTFPAGEIEPDPDVLPGAAQAFRRWSSSSLLFVRAVPECTVIPLIVRGVLHPGPQRSPLVLLKRTRADRERMAAMLQVLVHTVAPAAWRTHASLEVLPPVAGRRLLSLGDGAHAFITEMLVDAIRSRGPAGPGSSAPGNGQSAGRLRQRARRARDG